MDVSREMMAEVLDRAGIGLAAFDGEGRLLHGNQALAALLGRRPEDLLGRPFREAVDQDQWGAVLDALDEAAAGGKDSWPLEHRFKRPDGRTVWVRLTAVPRPAGSPENRPGFLIVEDLTQVKSALPSLEASQESFAALFEHARAGIIRFGSDRKVTQVNRRGAELLGYEPKEVIGLDAAKLISAESMGGAEMDLRKMETQASDGYTAERLVRRKDGTRFPCQVNVTPIRDRAGRIQSAVSVFFDLTEDKLAEEERSRLERLRGAAETTRAACHEMGQPLQALTMLVDLLTWQFGSNPELAQKLGEVSGHLDRLAQITRKIQMIARHQTSEYLR